eukprot:jgi/Hompol1/6025/HPOL_002351-RA
MIFPALVHYYASRRVRSITVFNGGKSIGIETYVMVGKRLRVFPQRHISSSARADGSVNESYKQAGGLGDQLYLKPDGWRGGFIVDKSGKFPDAKLFDYLFRKD